MLNCSLQGIQVSAVFFLLLLFGGFLMEDPNSHFICRLNASSKISATCVFMYCFVVIDVKAVLKEITLAEA